VGRKFRSCLDVGKYDEVDALSRLFQVFEFQFDDA